MSLKLDDMLKKAASRGIKPSQSSKKIEIIKPWQQESVLYKNNNQDEFLQKKNEFLFQNNNNNQKNIKITDLNIINSNANVNNISNNQLFEYELIHLKGLKGQVFNYIVNICIQNSSSITGPLNTCKMATDIGCSYGTLKIILIRLIKSNFIKRLKGKRSQAGYINILIEEKTKEFYLKLTSKTFNVIDNRMDNSLDNIQYLDNNQLTSLTEEEIDISPLSEINFSSIHLKQILSFKVLDKEKIQNSIYAFAFDLKENNKASQLQTSPLNYFMGILRKGLPYAPSSNYESPNDKVLREYNEKMREIVRKRVALEQEALVLAFEEWNAKLTLEEKNTFYPPSIRKLNEGGMKLNFLKNYFKENIWNMQKSF